MANRRQQTSITKKAIQRIDESSIGFILPFCRRAIKFALFHFDHVDEVGNLLLLNDGYRTEVFHYVLKLK